MCHLGHETRSFCTLLAIAPCGQPASRRWSTAVVPAAQIWQLSKQSCVVLLVRCLCHAAGNRPLQRHALPYLLPARHGERPVKRSACKTRHQCCATTSSCAVHIFNITVRDIFTHAAWHLCKCITPTPEQQQLSYFAYLSRHVEKTACDVISSARLDGACGSTYVASQSAADEVCMYVACCC